MEYSKSDVLVYAIFIVISLVSLLYLLVTHLWHCYYLAIRKSGFETSRKLSNRNIQSREADEFRLITYSQKMTVLTIFIIIVNIAYLSVKFVVNLGQSNLNCSRITICFLFIISISLWTTEIFFYLRGMKIVDQSGGAFGMKEEKSQKYVLCCKIGISFCVICLILQLTLISIYVNYHSFIYEDGYVKCGHDNENIQPLLICGFTLMALFLLLTLMALYIFTRPLMESRKLLRENLQAIEHSEASIAKSKTHSVTKTESTMSGAAEHDEKTCKHGKPKSTNKKLQRVLASTIVRVCTISAVTHGMLLICGIFCILIMVASGGSNVNLGNEVIYRCMTSVATVLTIIMMDLSFADWKRRMFPFFVECGKC